MVAPYLSPRTRELLTAAGAGWFDASGNLRLQLDRPAVFRGIDQVLTALKKYDGHYAITAEAATRPYLPRGQAAVAPLALLTNYVADATAVAGSLQLRPVDRGANVVMVEPFDAVVYRGSTMKDRLAYAAPSQVLADLLTGPGRAPEEGASLIEALARKDDGWTR